MLVPLQRVGGWLARNTPARSRTQIAAHYDLGNELFSHFLDRTMMYSCAVFESPDATLEEASLAKLERICRKLRLSADDHVLEIGTGWGGFAEYAAERYGCRVTTTTISAEQHAYASRRIRDAGLEDRVTVLFEDYRDLRGRYDKLVSIEMIEAVGWQYFPTFFRRCSELVADHGAMLLQAIVIEDRAYEVEKAARSFVNTHVFPGGCLPSLQVIARIGRTRHRLARSAARGHHRALRNDAAPLARALRRRRPRASPSSATTSASGASGSSTSATARAASASGVSRTCSCCWPSPASAEEVVDAAEVGSAR